ncbi:MAG TPA: hypothetical protein VM286_03650 [Candidatus Thermoplasmatota archaeon]|nr:hypothetical protein [Candidatus Thermoplasmatota archaeon]
MTDTSAAAVEKNRMRPSDWMILATGAVVAVLAAVAIYPNQPYTGNFGVVLLVLAVPLLAAFVAYWLRRSA